MADDGAVLPLRAAPPGAPLLEGQGLREEPRPQTPWRAARGCWPRALAHEGLGQGAREVRRGPTQGLLQLHHALPENGLRPVTHKGGVPQEWTVYSDTQREGPEEARECRLSNSHAWICTGIQGREHFRKRNARKECLQRELQYSTLNRRNSPVCVSTCSCVLLMRTVAL